MNRFLRFVFLMFGLGLLGQAAYAQCPVALKLLSVESVDESCQNASDGQVLLTFDQIDSPNYIFKLQEESSGKIITAPDNPFSEVEIIHGNGTVEFRNVPPGKYQLMVTHFKPNCYYVWDNPRDYIKIAVSETSCQDEK